MMLQVAHLSRRHDGRLVVDDLSFAVKGGEWLGLIGPNGAGKSTLFDLLAGTLRAQGGRILLQGRDVTGLGLVARVRAGIARAFQAPRPFASLTVSDHLALVGGTALLRPLGLYDLRHRLGADLGLADARRLELAKALALRPKVLLLDEVLGGLSGSERQAMITLIAGLRRPDLAVIWVEHAISDLCAVCDRLMLLDHGRKRVEGLPGLVAADPLVQEIYLG
ncbi:ATP-binding cassette domain-containing protein [Rhodobacter sp. KR11]|jgi:branched-chain amino acid transport system ATP-binding protein|uniref:ABC transporter ATP-binding protein n=1 Tax=Rhodobacter sp. KR11 TaxID=2974588 RepID=UPI0022233674|nr:ATP-binding cassette domain-containing protein [Rhodobacter sp. KR11]MCW1917502.1 ATP-binding cassette domain-containing protein [Rhodobacter sp. KR11]